MKMISCNIIKDVLPLYVDEVVSNDTKSMVEEHLKYCEECSKEIAAMKKEVVLPTNQKLQLKEAKVLKKFKKSWRNKKIIVSVISVIITLAIVTGVYALMITPRQSISYDSSLISVEVIDGIVYAHYYGDTYQGYSAINPTTLDIHGEEKNVVILYYYETPWSKYIEPLYKKDEQRREQRFMFDLGNENQIDEVYYGEFSGAGIFDNLPSALSDMNKIWWK